MLLRFVTFTFFVALLSVSTNLAAPRDEATQKRLEKYWRILETIDGDVLRVAASIRPGTLIGEFEAYVLASAYFDVYVNGCGGVELPKERGDLWIAESAEGIAGGPGPRIIVEKKTGLTYSPGRRKVRDPKEYLKFIRKPSNQAKQRTK